MSEIPARRAQERATRMVGAVKSFVERALDPVCERISRVETRSASLAMLVEPWRTEQRELTRRANAIEDRCRELLARVEALEEWRNSDE